MKCLLLFPESYTLADNFVNALETIGFDCKKVDFNNFFSASEKRRNSYLLKLPLKYRWKVIEGINRKVNTRYRNIFEEYSPDLVLVYNEQKLTKDTAAYFRQKSKLIFYLGDHPLFIQNRPDNLSAILEGHHILCPDSYWMEQMKIMGAEDVHFFIPGYTDKLNYVKKLSEEDKLKYGSDMVFIGRQYHDTFGFKRALFLNPLCGQNFKIYGDKSWFKWFRYFPDLEKHFVLNQSYLPFEMVNTILNASKVYPVDANPGIINGIHVRILECMGSGILPVAEYRKDISQVFNEVEVPQIHDYRNALNAIKKWTNDDNGRIEKIKDLRKFIKEKYSPSETGKNLLRVLS